MRNINKDIKAFSVSGIGLQDKHVFFLMKYLDGRCEN